VLNHSVTDVLLTAVTRTVPVIPEAVTCIPTAMPFVDASFTVLELLAAKLVLTTKLNVGGLAPQFTVKPEGLEGE